MLQKPRHDLAPMVAQIVQANPFLEYVAPAENPDDKWVRDEWGFVQRTEEILDWELFAADTREKDIYVSLDEQLREMNLPKLRYAACLEWLADLDCHGRISAMPLRIAKRAGCSTAEAENALALCRTLEPVGLFAYNVFECFKMQVANRPDVLRFIDILPRIIEEGKLAFCKRTRNSMRDIEANLAVLRGLRRTFHVTEPDKVLEAEAEIRFVDGAWAVRWLDDVHVALCNEEHKPKLNEDPTKWREARALVGTLRQRRDTLVRLLHIICIEQSRFIETLDPADIRPLSHAKVADMLELHQTTIGRAVAGKSVLIKRKEIALSSFFSTRVSVNESTVATQAKLKALLLEWPGLTDSQAAAQMNLIHGILIARRTVTSYREAMGLASKGRR